MKVVCCFIRKINICMGLVACISKRGELVIASNICANVRGVEFVEIWFGFGGISICMELKSGDSGCGVMVVSFIVERICLDGFR